MVEPGLMVGAFLALLVFIVVALHHELEFSVVISGLLGVSVVSVGLLVAVVVQVFVGLTALHTIMVLGGLLFAVTVTYELVS
jgi:hypothetical protein